MLDYASYSYVDYRSPRLAVHQPKKALANKIFLAPSTTASSFKKGSGNIGMKFQAASINTFQEGYMGNSRCSPDSFLIVRLHMSLVTPPVTRHGHQRLGHRTVVQDHVLVLHRILQVPLALAILQLFSFSWTLCANLFLRLNHHGINVYLLSCQQLLRFLCLLLPMCFIKFDLNPSG